MNLYKNLAIQRRKHMASIIHINLTLKKLLTHELVRMRARGDIPELQIPM